MSTDNARDHVSEANRRRISRRTLTGSALALGASAKFLNSSSASQGTPPASRPSQPFPVTDEKVTFRVLVPSNASVEDFTTNTFTQWYEEQTNVHLEWEVVPEQEAQTSLNVRLASGDYPDLIMHFNPEPALQMVYGSQGVFLRFNELIDEYGVGFQQVTEDYPLARDVITAPNGDIYSLPQVNDCYHCSLSQKLWIYKPWLDQLGMAMPTTLDEFEQVLVAFKDRDPNANQASDEVPLVSATQGWQTTLDAFFMNAFIFNPVLNSSSANPGGDRLILQDGTITAVFTTAEWRTGVEYLARLYAEGLIAPETFTQDLDQLKQLGNNPDAPIVGSVPAGHPGVFMDIDSLQGGRWTEYETVPPLTGPEGIQLAVYHPYQPFITGNFIITSACQQPEVAFRWADGLYGQEATMRSVFGVPGENWRWAEAGEIGLNGEPAIWKRLSSFGGVQNYCWRQTGPSYRSNEFRLGEAIDPAEADRNLEAILYRETSENYEPYAQPAEWVVPPLFFTEEQSQEVAELGAVINPYVQETFALGITGQVDIAAEWETFQDTLDSMGLGRYLQIHQEAYDARAAG